MVGFCAVCQTMNSGPALGLGFGQDRRAQGADEHNGRAGEYSNVYKSRSILE